MSLFDWIVDADALADELIGTNNTIDKLRSDHRYLTEKVYDIDSGVDTIATMLRWALFFLVLALAVAGVGLGIAIAAMWG